MLPPPFRPVSYKTFHKSDSFSFFIDLSCTIYAIKSKYFRVTSQLGLNIRKPSRLGSIIRNKMNRKRLVTNHSDGTFAKFTSQFINSPFDYSSIMSEKCHNVLRDIALAKHAPFGSLFLTILTTINFIAAAAKTKIQMTRRAGQWFINLNTYGIFIGPPSCGKTPTIKAAINEPLNALECNLKDAIKGRLTMASLADNLSDQSNGHRVFIYIILLHRYFFIRMTFLI